MDPQSSSPAEAILALSAPFRQRSDRRLHVAAQDGSIEVVVSRLTPRVPKVDFIMLMLSLGVLLGILGLGSLIGALRLLIDPELEQTISLGVFLGLLVCVRYAVVPALLDQVRLEFREGALVVSRRRWLLWTEQGSFRPGDAVTIRWKNSLLPTHFSASPHCLELVTGTRVLPICRRRPAQDMLRIAGMIRRFLDGKPIAELDTELEDTDAIRSDKEPSTPLKRLRRLGFATGAYAAFHLVVLVVAFQSDCDLARVARGLLEGAVTLWIAGRLYVAPWKPYAIPSLSEAMRFLPIPWIVAVATGALLFVAASLLTPFLSLEWEALRLAAPAGAALAITLCIYPLNRALLLKELSLGPPPAPLDEDPLERHSEEAQGEDG